MTNEETQTAAERNLLAFVRGVEKAFEEAGVETDEYTSHFWSNITGSEFTSEEEAFAGGMEIAENELHKD